MEGVANSRRSTVYSSRGMVSSTQPLANSAGIKILSAGGNCVDACVAIAACLCVLEPSSTGIGGDCFCLYYKNEDKKVYGLNGTGRSASALNADWIKENHPDHILDTSRLKEDSVFKVQIPGHVAGWCDVINSWGSGKVSLSEILQPAIDLSENGFVVSQISSHLWECAETKLKRENPKNDDLALFLPNDGYRAPKKGQFMKNIPLAKTLKEIAKHGKKGFYEGEIGESIVSELKKRGSLISSDDLVNHTSTFVDPISLNVLGHNLWEIPPNGSGIIALIALGLINELNSAGIIDFNTIKHNSAEYLHVIIECLKLSFKDSDEYVNDYEFYKKIHGLDQHSSLKDILNKGYFKKRIELFSKNRTISNKYVKHGIPNPMFKSDTVYLTAADSNGDTCSFICSLYENFGSGILIPGKGFCMQNRGGNFNLNSSSRNCLEGNKRSYHTIIPGMITVPKEKGRHDLYASFGIMGGYNQPQAHVQVYLNMLLYNMDPQEALDAPRISLFPHPDYTHTDSKLGADGPVSRDMTCVGIEEGISSEVVNFLQELGHCTAKFSGNERSLFGRGQIIRREQEFTDGNLVYSGGSDMRGDGASVPLL